MYQESGVALMLVSSFLPSFMNNEALNCMDAASGSWWLEKESCGRATSCFMLMLIQ